MVSVVDHKLGTSLYRKETDKNTLLRYDSCHPWRMEHSLPFSQMLWAKRIVDKEPALEETLVRMKENFRDRGYPQKIIDQHRERVQKM